MKNLRLAIVLLWLSPLIVLFTIGFLGQRWLYWLGRRLRVRVLAW